MSTPPATDTGASAFIPGYLDAGFKLIPIPLGKKGPTHAGWNVEVNCLVAGDWTGNLGLALAYSTLATIDVDAYTLAKAWLALHGIDLDALLTAPDAVRIESGNPDHAKLLYRLPAWCDRMSTRKITQDGVTIIEFRNSTKNGRTVQDLIPPSLHPTTGKAYQWGGDWRNIPEIPLALLQVWQNLETESKDHGMGSTSGSSATRAEVESALKFLDADLPRGDWIKVGMAIKSFDPNALDLFDRWSSLGAKYEGVEDTTKVWNSFKSTDGGIGIGTLFMIAKEAGWTGYIVPIEQLFGVPGQSVQAPGEPFSGEIGVGRGVLYHLGGAWVVAGSAPAGAGIQSNIIT